MRLPGMQLLEGADGEGKVIHARTALGGDVWLTCIVRRETEDWYAGVWMGEQHLAPGVFVDPLYLHESQDLRVPGCGCVEVPDRDAHVVEAGESRGRSVRCH